MTPETHNKLIDLGMVFTPDFFLNKGLAGCYTAQFENGYGVTFSYNMPAIMHNFKPYIIIVEKDGKECVAHRSREEKDVLEKIEAVRGIAV